MKVIKQLRAIVATLMLCAISSVAAQAPKLGPVPVDPQVRIGHLDNGLTYYIRHNEYPKGLADFFIAQKVGSVLEEDNQRGLAHFLEHMCFNGTKNFPDSTLLNWTESVGVKFGQNLNAYTSTDETVYYLSKVPVQRTGVQDSCLLILHDWADALTLAPKEIDKERGVIHEEWRSRNVGEQRINEAILPTIYPGSRYAHRMPIGTMEVVDNFPYSALRDYYEKWYRPDLQGIVVVGDIDPDRIEQQIKAIFSDIKLDPDRAERVYYPVPDTPGTIFAIGKDKEVSQARIEIINKFDQVPDSEKSDITYLINNYIDEIIEHMLNARLNDMMSKPETPFAAAGSYIGNFFMSKTKGASTIVGIGKGNSIEPTFEAIYRELLRARKGFTHAEYERARAEYLSQLESAYNSRTTIPSNNLGFEYVRNFLDNEPIPGIEYEYSHITDLAKRIPVEVINMALPELWRPDNRIVIAYLPDKEGYAIPTEQALRDIMARVDAEKIDDYVDNVKTEPLITGMPVPGKIVSESHDSIYDATVWKLSNGATVEIKPTDFNDNEIQLMAVAKGGTSTVTDADSTNLIYLGSALSMSGLGDYNSSDLEKYMAGRQASVRFLPDDQRRIVIGNSTVKDLPTMMELLYMTLTETNISESDFAAGQEIYRGLIHNQESKPDYHFKKAVQNNLYKSPRNHSLSLDAIDKADRKRILEIIRDQLADVQNFTFVFTGKVTPDSLRAYVEQYIASIPAGKSSAGVVPEVSAIAPGSLTEQVTYPMDTPQTYAAIVMSGNMDYNPKNNALTSMASQILTARLLKQVREDMGATYSIHAYGQLARTQPQNAVLQIVFPMKPEMKNDVLAAIADQIDRMAEEITDEEMAKVKEYMAKSYKEQTRKNAPWANAIANYSINGFDTFLCAPEVMQAITAADVKAYMKDLIDQNNYKVIILDPR